MTTGILVNGHAYSAGSIRLSMNADRSRVFDRFFRVSYRHGLSVGIHRGNVDPRPLADTDGEYSADASISLYLEDWRDLRSLLMETDEPGGFMQRHFSVSLEYAEEGLGAMSDELRTCRITEVSRSTGRGSDAVAVDLRLYVKEIREDGIRPVTYPNES